MGGSWVGVGDSVGVGVGVVVAVGDGVSVSVGGSVKIAVGTGVAGTLVVTGTSGKEQAASKLPIRTMRIRRENTILFGFKCQKFIIRWIIVGCKFES
jgi:hypothetical protein